MATPRKLPLCLIFPSLDAAGWVFEEGLPLRPALDWTLNRRTIAAPAEGAILTIAHFRYAIREPDPTGDQHQEDHRSRRICDHAMAIIVRIVIAISIFFEVFDGGAARG
jgi:hypothetical protein